MPKKLDGDKREYTREALLKSKHFVDVQRDFLAVILDQDRYTLADARAAVNDFLREE